MSALVVVAIILLVATTYGLWDKSRAGKIKPVQGSDNLVVAKDIGSDLGERATLLQFSSAFCAPCRTTRSTLASVISHYPKIKHVEVDAESNLELVRRLDIRQTPTTIFLNAYGKEIARAVGAPKRDQVIYALERI
jgi:thiol-disulfide isomerase/thioredoxin